MAELRKHFKRIVSYFSRRNGLFSFQFCFIFPTVIILALLVLESLRTGFFTKITFQFLMFSRIKIANEATRPPVPFPLPLLIAILSSGSQFEQRDAVRRTWGNVTYLKSMFDDDVRGPYFFVGQSDDEKLANEMAHFGDIIKVQVAEDFRELTPKMFRVLEWVQNELLPPANSYYVLKTDDDAYVNVVQIVKTFYKNLTQPPPDSKSFYCYVIRKAQVNRDPNSKLYVSRDVYGSDLYPNYCSGITYLFSASLLGEILGQASKMLPLPNEDTFFTGTVANELGIGHISLGRVEPFSEAGSWGQESLCKFGSSDYQVVHRVTPTEMAAIHSCVKAINTTAV